MERIYNDSAAIHNLPKELPSKQSNKTLFAVKPNILFKAFSGLGLQTETKNAVVQKIQLPAKAMALFLILLSTVSYTQAAIRTWTGGTGTGKDWTLASNWGGTAPASGDDIVFNTPGVIEFSVMPSSTAYKSLTISQGAITLANGTLTTLTLSGNAGVDFTIASGCSLTLSTNVNIALANPATADISGTLTINSGSTYDAGSATGVATYVNNGGSIINYGAVTNNTPGRLFFYDGSNYWHNRDGGAIPAATWYSGSTCTVTGITSTSCTGLNATFWNLTWNCSSQTIAQNLGSAAYSGNFAIQNTGSGSIVISSSSNETYTGNGDFTMSGGTLDLSSSTFNGSLWLKKNFSISGGTITRTGTGTANIRFYPLTSPTPPVTQQYSKTGGTFSGDILFRVMSNAILDMGTSIIDGSSGSFSMDTIATLITANSQGIAKTGATGSIQVTGTRTYNIRGNYIYNGTVAQITGSGLTAAKNLTINNAAGVTLSGKVTLNSLTIGDVTANTIFNDNGNQITSTGTLNFNHGTFKLGTATATIFPAFTSMTIKPTATIEYASTSAQQVSGTPQYANLTFSGASTKTAQGALTVNENLTISAGTFAAGAFTHSIGKNWINNGTFTAGTSTINLNGTAGQSIGGSSPTEFNNLSLSNSAGATMGNDIKVSSLLDLSNGALSLGNYTLRLDGTITGMGTLTGGNGSILAISGTSGGNLGTINFTGGTGTLNTFTINRSGTTPSVTLGSNLTVSAGSGGGTMTITSGVLTLQSGKWLTVDGTLANSTSANLIIESGSSLIQKSSGVNATVKREIVAAEWGTWNDGWHFLSSPVAGQAISSGGFTTSGAGNDFDFYTWYENDNLWINYKNTTVSPTWNDVNGSTNFLVGKGYLAAYQMTSTKEFSGVLNYSDVTVSGLTNNNTTENHSWNLLGNPYPASLNWDASWTKTNVGGVCQVWSEALRDYSAISSGTIPAMNGFMVEVTTAPAQITIPATKQIHAVNTWLKSTDSEGQLKLTVMAEDNSSGKEAFIQLNPEATELFDLEYDGHYLRGYGPVFYSLAGTDTLSVNTLPAFNESLIIPLVFQKNEGADYVLTVSGVENFEVPIYLTDKKTGVIQNLGYNPVYSFSSVEGDNINRFTLSFKSPTSIKEETEENLTVSVENGVITLRSDQSLTGTVKVSDMLGRSIATENMVADTPLQINLNSTPGVYVVTVYTKSKTYSQKVVIR